MIYVFVVRCDPCWCNFFFIPHSFLDSFRWKCHPRGKKICRHRVETSHCDTSHCARACFRTVVNIKTAVLIFRRQYYFPVSGLFNQWSLSGDTFVPSLQYPQIIYTDTSRKSNRSSNHDSTPVSSRMQTFLSPVSLMQTFLLHQSPSRSMRNKKNRPIHTTVQ